MSIWVRVRAEKELRVGMAIRRSDLGETAIITNRYEVTGEVPCSSERLYCTSLLRWHDTESGKEEGFEAYCLREFIDKGVVFRLADEFVKEDSLESIDQDVHR